jgi:phosphatidylinositol dimannoside acyltransferase
MPFRSCANLTGANASRPRRSAAVLIRTSPANSVIAPNREGNGSFLAATKTKKTSRRATFQQEERHEFRGRLSIAIAATLSWIAVLVPTPVRNYLAARIGAIFFRVSHTYRRYVEENVRHVLGKEENDGEVRDLTYSIFITNAINFMDLLTLPRRSRRYLHRATYVVSGDWREIERIHASGQGIIFVSAHVGCFDFIGQALQARGYPLTVVTGRTTSRFIFDGVTWLRKTRGSTLVEPTPSGIRTVIKALRRGECAVIVSDRDFFENGAEVEFFGQRTTLPPGAVRIARDTGAVLVPVFTRRTRRGNQLRIYPPMTIEKTSNVKEDVKRGMEQLVPVLEDGIDAALEQWVMFARVWRDVPAESVKIFPTGSPLESELLEKVVSHLPERKTGEDGD